MKRVFRFQGEGEMNDIGLRGLTEYPAVNDLNPRVTIIQALTPWPPDRRGSPSGRGRPPGRLPPVRPHRGQPGLVWWSAQGGGLSLPAGSEAPPAGPPGPGSPPEPEGPARTAPAPPGPPWERRRGSCISLVMRDPLLPSLTISDALLSGKGAGMPRQARLNAPGTLTTEPRLHSSEANWSAGPSNAPDLLGRRPAGMRHGRSHGEGPVDSPLRLPKPRNQSPRIEIAHPGIQGLRC